MGGIYYLQHTNVDHILVIAWLPMFLRVSNTGEHPVMIEEIVAHFHAAYPPRWEADFLTPDLRTWSPQYEYTGAAEADYIVFNVEAPEYQGHRSILEQGDQSSCEVSRFKRLVYRIPPHETDIVGVSISPAKEAFPASDDRTTLKCYSITFETRGVLDGRPFTLTYKSPFHLAVMSQALQDELYSRAKDVSLSQQRSSPDESKARR
jgi:hypothetical protein